MENAAAFRYDRAYGFIKMTEKVMFQLNQIALRARSLVVFRRLLDDAVVRAFLNLLTAENAPEEKVDRYASFAHLLFQSGENFTAYVWRLVVSDENTYVRLRARKAAVSETIEGCVRRELAVLRALSTLSARDVKAGMPQEIDLPEWTTDELFDFEAAYADQMDRLATAGFGIYSNARMFTYHAGAIVPVMIPDPIRLSQLTGYERERGRLVQNTLAFWEEKPVANALLYGDAGTGKSSTVKAIVNEYWMRGLRLVEVRKADLLEIPRIIERLVDNPLKFILFIDDLSFAQGNEEIGALKAILEGSVAARGANVAIYATSNRRHLVKETFSDRSGDDVHLNETMQEVASLSERFGLAILFSKPNKDKYIEIVHALADAHGLGGVENIELLAEQYALERGGRSGRTARQFVEHIARMM